MLSVIQLKITLCGWEDQLLGLTRAFLVGAKRGNSTKRRDRELHDEAMRFSIQKFFKKLTVRWLDKIKIVWLTSSATIKTNDLNYLVDTALDCFPGKVLLQRWMSLSGLRAWYSCIILIYALICFCCSLVSGGRAVRFSSRSLLDQAANSLASL